MALRMRSASMYIDGTKIAEFEGTTYDLVGADEAQIGDGGYLGHSKGAITSRITATGIVPLAGLNVDMHDLKLKGTEVMIILAPLAGKIHTVRAVCTGVTIRNSHRAGTQQGDFTFEGAPPDIA